jgi:hypothetical protein
MCVQDRRSLTNRIRMSRASMSPPPESSIRFLAKLAQSSSPAVTVSRRSTGFPSHLPAAFRSSICTPWCVISSSPTYVLAYSRKLLLIYCSTCSGYTATHQTNLIFNVLNPFQINTSFEFFDLMFDRSSYLKKFVQI